MALTIGQLTQTVEDNGKTCPLMLIANGDLWWSTGDSGDA